MSHHLDIYQETKPATLPRVLKWPLFVVAFPIVLLTAVVWLPVFLLRRETPVNTTPCGRLCKYAYWSYSVGDVLILQEYLGGHYSGHEYTVIVTYVTDFPDALREDFVCMGIRPCPISFGE